jgi:hypothetical protein
MTSRPDTAAVVKQTLSDLAPSRLGAIKLHGVEALDLDGAPAAGAVDSEQLARDLRQPPLLDRKPGLSGSSRIRQDAIPPFHRRRLIWRRLKSVWRSGIPVKRQPFHLLCSRHTPGGKVIVHSRIRT